MDKVLAQGDKNLEYIIETLTLETSVNNLKAKTFILKTGHTFGINQQVSGEKICTNKQEDYRERIMRYFSLLQIY